MARGADDPEIGRRLAGEAVPCGFQVSCLRDEKISMAHCLAPSHSFTIQNLLGSLTITYPDNRRPTARVNNADQE